MAVGATVKNFIFPFLRELKLWYVSICGLETTKTNKTETDSQIQWTNWWLPEWVGGRTDTNFQLQSK